MRGIRYEKKIYDVESDFGVRRLLLYSGSSRRAKMVSALQYELENVLERAINLLDEDYIIKAVHLPDKMIREKYVYHYDDKKERYLYEILENVERDIIEKTLKENGWNKNKTARMLGISRAGLYNKIEQYHLSQ